MIDLSPVLQAAVRTATPLLVASTGELVTERAGMINIALEGCIIAGAYAAFATASSPAAGYLSGVLAGTAVGALLVVFCVYLRRDQIVVGTALTMLALGITGTLFRAHAGTAPLVVAMDSAVPLPVVSDIPVLGSAFFRQPLVAYGAFAGAPIVWWFLSRTQAGLAVRAVGDAPMAARAAGIRTRLVQVSAALFGSAMGGLAGAILVLAQAGSFAEGMSAGRGFLAVAIVALGRWRPAGVMISSFVFGAAMALQFVVQAMGWTVRYELVLMIPYLLTLGALGAFGRAAAPSMLGRTLPTDASVNT